VPLRRRAASTAGGDATPAVVHRDDVDQVDQAGGQAEGRTGERRRAAPAVPAGEGLRQVAADRCAQPELLGQPRGDLAVRGEGLLDGPAAGGEHPRGLPGPVQRRAARARVPQQEAEQRQPAKSMS
jgi:hypothetical protein